MSSKHEIPAPQPSPCPECHGERVAAKALNDMRLIKPDAVFPDNRIMTELWALACTSCGHTTFYAKDPHVLLPKT